MIRVVLETSEFGDLDLLCEREPEVGEKLWIEDQKNLQTIELKVDSKVWEVGGYSAGRDGRLAFIRLRTVELKRQTL